MKDKFKKCVPQGMNKPVKVTKKFKKGTSRFTIMLIPDSSNPSRTFELSYDKIIRWITIILAALAIIICLGVSLSLRHRNEVYGANGYVEQIESLTAENEAYKDRDDALIRQNTSLNNKLAVYEALEKQEEENIITSDVPVLSPLCGVYVRIKDPSPEADRYSGLRVSYDMMESTQIVATGYGRISKIGEDGFYKNVVVIDHENGYKTYYRWQGDVRISLGEYVERGQSIGNAAMDDALACYEMTRNEINIDPLTMIESEAN